MRATQIGLAAALLVVACSKGGSPADEAVAQLVSSWKQAGLEPGAFTAVEAKIAGGECRAGSVSGVDTTLCSFADEAAARAAEPAGLAQVGESTGVSLAAGRSLLIVVDRRQADPSGKHINDIVKAFRPK